MLKVLLILSKIELALWEGGWSSDSDNIVFENSDDDEQDSNSDTSRSCDNSPDDTDGCASCDPASTSPSKKSNVKEVQLMYIQMEFCDNQTLRSAIDKDLYKDTKRVWKMFREIIEGLLHIHR